MLRPDDAAHLGMAIEDAAWIEDRLLQRAVPAGKIDVDLADFDAVVARVAHKLGRRVETHGLGVEDRRAEDVGIKGLEPAGGVDQQCEGRCMAFRKAVFAETLDLLEAALGKLFRIALLDHARDQVCHDISAMVPLRLKVAMARRSLSASLG